MKASKIYQQLEKDFILPEMSDKWAEYMTSVSDFLSDNFKSRSMGLVCDFAKNIEKVYTAVFPSAAVMQKILDSGVRNALLFVHHPSIWDIRRAPGVFFQMDRNQLKQFRERGIAVYNLHVPLDNYGNFATSVTLAKALGIEVKKPFAPYFGGLCGVIGKTNKDVNGIRNKFREIVGHDVALYKYGDDQIKEGLVAVIAGGGNDEEMLEQVANEGVNTFVTGITAKNDHSRNAHEFAERKKINVLGGTHYSTERFACIAMVEYFEKLGLDSEFIEDKPILEDM